MITLGRHQYSHGAPSGLPGRVLRSRRKEVGMKVLLALAVLAIVAGPIARMVHRRVLR